MTGLDVLCRSLAELGVRHVFGLPGTQNAEFFSALPGHGIRPVLATHEASASFMANGYARASGRVGVLATIPGPGFTFALPGLAEARLDSVPLLHLVGTPSKGRTHFAHQSIDQKRIAEPLVKAVIHLGSVNDVRERVCEAHRLALAGEPGPVLLHLDPDVLCGPAAKRHSSEAPGEQREEPEPSRRWADELRALVQASERPVLFAGGGALGASEALARLAERLSAPTFTTLTARGVLPEDHPCSLGFDADRGGLDALNSLLDQSDLVVALGCKLSHNGTSGFHMRLSPDRLVHVNTDGSALGTSYPARLQIRASVEDVISVLAEPAAQSRSCWDAEDLDRLRATIGRPAPPRTPEPRFVGMPGGTPEAFFRGLRGALPRDSVVVTDSGLHQAMTRRYLQVLAPRGLITPADFQSMGFGLPAAIGAALAVPGRPVVAIVGDGGFLMSAMDLACAVREHIPVVVIVFNDGYLNLIRLQQVRDDGRSTAVRLSTPNLASMADAVNASYAMIHAGVEATVREALGDRGPSLLEVRLSDSPDIQIMTAKGRAKHLVRRTVGRNFIDHLRNLVRRLTPR